jgi:hypothetical protein
LGDGPHHPDRGPDLGAKLVDLDPSATAEASARAILGELARGDTETQAARGATASAWSRAWPKSPRHRT